MDNWSFEPIFSLTEEQLSTVLVNLGASYTRPQGDNIQSSRCFLHHNNSPTLGISIHAPHPWNCYDGETEVLTRTGWVKLSKFDPSQEVMEVWEDGRANFTSLLAYATEDKPVRHILSESLDLVVTDDHRMLAGYRKGKKDRTLSWREVPAKEFTAGHWSRSHCIYNQGYSKPHAPYLRLAVAYQADGSLHHSGGATFGFTKKRKIDRLTQLLEEANVIYTHRKAGSFYIPDSITWREVRQLLGGKQYDPSRILALDSESLSLFCEEIPYWDGCEKYGYVYYNTAKQSVDAVQMAFALKGIRCSALWSEQAGQWTLRRIKASFSRGVKGFSNLDAGIARVYALQVPSSWLLVRRHNKIVVSGNCFVPECHKGTDLISLVSAALGIKREVAVEWIYETLPEVAQEKRGALFKSRTEAEEGRFVLSSAALAAYPLAAENELGYRAIAYLNLCSREQAEEFKLHYDRRHHRVIFPVFHADGLLAGLIGRSALPNVPKKGRWYNYDEGSFNKAHCLMGAELPLVPDQPICLCEGPSDYIFLRSCGVPNVRATMGANFSEWQLETLVAYGHDILPLFDKDKAGEAALFKFRKRVNKRCKLLTYTYPEAYLNDDGSADPRSIGEEGLKALLSSVGKLSFIRRS